MKKSAIFFIITALLILFSACSIGEQNKDEIIADNPIDKEFIWGSEGCESEARIMMAADYIRQWETEIDYAVELISIEYAFTGNIEWEKHNNKYMRRKESTYDSQRTTKNIFRV